MTPWLENRVAIVTGAGRGIGRATAMLMAGQGASVVVNDLGCEIDGSGTSGEPADCVVEEINKSGGTAVANHDSVATMDGAGKITQCALDSFGRVDILVNNAGILFDKLFVDTTEEEYEALLNVNLKGPFNCLKAVLPHMIDQQYGRIVNISSGAGLGVVRGEVAYGSTKAGLDCLTRGVSLEVKKEGITLNSIMPVAMTRLQEAALKQVAAGITESTPGIDRNQPPETIAPIIGYLAGEKAGSITGHTFTVRFTGTIQVMNEQTPLRTAYKEGTWTVEEIGKVMPQLVPAGG